MCVCRIKLQGLIIDCTRIRVVSMPLARVMWDLCHLAATSSFNLNVIWPNLINSKLAIVSIYRNFKKNADNMPG